MSEKLPYEEQLAQQWNDLSLPDENMAWTDMKRRLEEDDDKPVVAWWRRGCGMWGLLLLLLLTAGWFIVRPEKWFSNSKKENIVAKGETVSGNQKNKNGKANGNSSNDKSENNTQTNSSNDRNTVTTPIDTNTPGNNATGDNTSSTTNTINTKPGNGNTGPVSNPAGNDRTNANNPVTAGRNNPVNTNRSITNSNSSASQSTHLTSGNRSVGNRTRGQRGQTNPPVSTKPDHRQSSGNTAGQLQGNPVNNNTKEPVAAQPNSPAVAIPKVIGPDSSITKLKTPADPIIKKDSAVKKPVIASANKEKEKKKTYFSAGIAVHQLLPVAGQKSSPYNALGRKGTLLDYIPSAYLRFHKENKWFIQAEFRYGAPQFIKNKEKDGLLYDQKIVTDTGQNPRYVHTTSTRLQKTYYHQLPLSFNYYVMPNWSIGAGVVWNKFKTAVSESEINRHDNFLQRDSLFPKTITKVAGDSATQFSKSYFQAMFETQYQWKRFSIGGRYAVGIDPYIRFTLPNQSPRQERNQSVQLFIRYQLWRSKSK